MVSKLWRLVPARPHLLRRWQADVSGATLVQFVIVLPVFILIVLGVWNIYAVYAAHQTLCEAAAKSARYLQVEGRLLDPDEYPYPDGWEVLAADMINSELKSSTLIKLAPLSPSQVAISPEIARMSPKDMSEVRSDRIPDYWFFVQAETVITNPLAIFMESDSSGTLSLKCKESAYYEAEPIGPSPQPPKPPRSECPPVPPCGGPTPGGPGRPTPSPTPCPPGQTCQPTPCPPCEP